MFTGLETVKLAQVTQRGGEVEVSSVPSAGRVMRGPGASGRLSSLPCVLQRSSREEMAREFPRSARCPSALFCDLTPCPFWKKAECVFAYTHTVGEETRNLDPFLASSLFPVRLALWLLCTGFIFNQNAEGPGSLLAVTQ